MADKRGTATEMLDHLEKICADLEAFRYLYKTSEVRWAVHLNDYRKANCVRDEQRFRAVRDSLQKRPRTDPVFEDLKDSLEKVLLS